MSLFKDIKNGLEEAIDLHTRDKDLPEVLENTKETREYLDSLPRIYLVVRYFKIAILEFPFVGKYEKAGKREKDHCDLVPLVYVYDDCNGTCDNYFLRKITNTTTVSIIDWCYSLEEAKELKEKKEKEEEDMLYES